MSEKFLVVAGRYAKALWESVNSEETEQVSKQLEEISSLIKGSDNLKTLAESPVFSNEEKKKVFGQMFETLSLSFGLKSFLNLLLLNDRIALLPDIQESFQNIYLNSRKTKSAVVETAFALSASQSEAIKNVLEAALDTKIEMESKQSPSLLAGIKIHVDGRTIDATLESNLNLLKDKLLVAEA